MFLAIYSEALVLVFYSAVLYVPEVCNLMMRFKIRLFCINRMQKLTCIKPEMSSSGSMCFGIYFQLVSNDASAQPCQGSTDGARNV